jgi:hypothetical protein
MKNPLAHFNNKTVIAKGKISEPDTPSKLTKRKPN